MKKYESEKNGFKNEGKIKEKIKMAERFKTYLDKEREINILIDGQEFRISKRQAEAIRYELFRILDIQAELRDLDWARNYFEEENY
jgi:hypothetical protein